MNLRNTAILFALFLTMLWVFGLMLTARQPLAEEGFLFPALKAEPTVAVNTISFERDLKVGKDSFAFVKQQDTWQLVVGRDSTVVDTSRVKKLIEKFKDARHNPDADVSRDLASLGLAPPRRSVTLKGRLAEKGPAGKERSWTLHLGEESADGMVVYALSDERPGEVFALTKGDVEPLLFDEPTSLRSLLFFNFPIEETAIRKIAVQTPKNVLELTQREARRWKFEKPGLGYAAYDPPPALKELKGKATEGVKGLIYAIRSLRVGAETDFMPLGKEPLASFGLEEGKESMRIEVVSEEETAKKELTREALLVGNSVPKNWNQVYVRMAGDPAVARMDVKHLAPIQKVVAFPGQLRSRDLAYFQPERLSRIEIRKGKQEVELSRTEASWKMRTDGARPRPADDEAVSGLIETLQGKEAVESFEPEPEDPKKTDAALGLDAPGLEVKIIEGDSEGQEEAKKEQSITTLRFGKTAGDVVHVQRTLADGQVSRFEVLKVVMERITGEDLALVYLDRALPPLDGDDVVDLAITRDQSPIELRRDRKEKEDRWLLKDPGDASGFVPAAGKLVQAMLEHVGRLRAQRWVKRVGRKDDLGEFGLERPTASVTLSVKDPFSPSNLGGLFGLGGTPLPQAGLLIAGGAVAQSEAAPPETIILKLGKDNGKEGAERGIFASHSGTDLVFLVPPGLLKELQAADFRDRQRVFALQPVIHAGLLAQAFAHPLHVVTIASPLATGRVHAFAPDQVKEFKFFLRTPEELRQFAFSRVEKNGWKDQTGLMEFNLESANVDRFLKQLAELRASRIVSLTGPHGAHKLTPKDAALRVELTMAGGDVLVLTVGNALEKLGYYAQSSAQPDVVFLLPPAPTESWLRGLSLFARDRLAVAP